jgi:peptide/nickel transport system substrate-binding protein
VTTRARYGRKDKRARPLNAAALFCFFCALYPSSARTQSVPAEKYGDAYVTSSISDARTLMPLLASDTASSAVTGMIFNGLVKYDKDLRLTGDLAQRWDIEDDGVTIIFHLRPGVRWHDGAPFTAADVEFTYRTLIDPKVKTPYSGDFERVKSLEVIDPLTVKVTYKEPFSPGLSSWGMPMIPKHLLEGKDLNSSQFARRPVGTGPYRFVRWNSQDLIELSSFREYFEGRPKIDRYFSLVIPDESMQFLQLITQGTDAAGLTPLQFIRQSDHSAFTRHYRKFRYPSFSYVYLGYNLAHPLFSSPRVRTALNLAVDKKEIIDIVLLGLGKPATGPFLPDSWAYNPEVRPAPYDPDQARSILQQEGWSDSDRDGILDKEGVPFAFTVITNQGNEERLKVAQIVQRRLSAIGIKVKIKVVEWSVFLTEHIGRRNFDAVLLGWSIPLDPDNYDIWHSSKTKEGEFNFVGYRNREVDELLTQARRTFDQSSRQRMYRQVHRLIYEDQPYLFLYVPDTLFALHRRFQNVAPAPAGLGYNFIEWWVPEGSRKYKPLLEP